MALARIGNARRVENFTWPGFVDALATLLMVIIFVLMVFVLIQVNLAYRVSGQDATLGEMRQQLASLGELLNIERRASADLAANLAGDELTVEEPGLIENVVEVCDKGITADRDAADNGRIGTDGATAAQQGFFVERAPDNL